MKLGVLSWVGTAKIWQESDATFAPLYFFNTLDSDPSVNSLGSKTLLSDNRNTWFWSVLWSWTLV